MKRIENVTKGYRGYKKGYSQNPQPPPLRGEL